VFFFFFFTSKVDIYCLLIIDMSFDGLIGCW